MVKICKSKMENNVNNEILKVERCFYDGDSMTFEEIVNSMIKEKVEEYFNPSYDNVQVNVATSDEEVA